MPASLTKNVVLTPQLGDFLDELMASGDYQSVSEVFRTGLLLVKKERERDAAELAEIQTRIAVGIDQLDRGEGIVGSPRQVLSERLKAMKERREAS